MHFNYGQHPTVAPSPSGSRPRPAKKDELAFDAGAFSVGKSDEMRMQVTVHGGSLLVSQNIAVFAPGNGTTYLPRAFTFVADSSTTRLTFEDKSATTQRRSRAGQRSSDAPEATPIITADPQSAAVPPGGNVNFAVTATGQQPPSYQWRFNDTPIGGADASMYEIVNAQPSDAGNYDVVVSNAAGSTPAP